MLTPHYHVGIVVADLEATRHRLGHLLGITWGPVMRLEDVSYRDGSGGDLMLPTTMCYSIDDPCLELIQEQPGTVWVRNEHSNLHHLGFWTEQLADDSVCFANAGCPLQLCGRDGAAAPVSFSYHRDDALGVRIELVDVSMREAMSFLFQADSQSI